VPHRLGPDNASLQIRTYREGVAARVGHDLVLEVTDWQATVDLDGDAGIVLTADPRSIEVREGVRGVKPLSDKDRREIRRNVAQKVLGEEPIGFRSTAVDLVAGRLTVAGELTIAGATGALTAVLEVGDDGRIEATIPLVQSAWGIRPYRGLMGALKVRDDVEIVIAARLPAA
jgi:polyisoprenoid-binding protein YceI